MIEQINIALEQKGPGISQPESLKPAIGRLTSEKRAYTSIKSDEEYVYPAFFPPNRTILLNSLNYEGIAVIELQFYHFHNSDRLHVGSVTD